MLDRLVSGRRVEVFMLVTLGEVKPDPQRYEQRGDHQGDDQVHRPGESAGDGRRPDGIRQRDLSSEFVADPPAQKGAQDYRRWLEGAEIGAGRNAQHDGSRDDGCHAESNAPIEILAVREPGGQSGEDFLRPGPISAPKRCRADGERRSGRA